MPTQSEFDFSPDKATEEKIRKLLRLAGNQAASPAEASAALAKARTMAARAGIDTESISTDEEMDHLAETPLAHIAVMAPRTIVETLAGSLVCEQFLCTRLVAHRRGSRTIHYFIGPSAFVALAGYVFEYLRKTMAKAWRTRTNRRLRDRRAFMAGFACAVSNAMPQEFRQRALTPPAEVEAYALEKIFGPGTEFNTPKSRKQKPMSTKAVTAGLAAGRGAGIRNALTA